MIPKKIYLNWLKENEGPNVSIWQREPLNELSDEYNSREYTDLSQVWHPASEESQEYPILCQDEFGNVWVQQTLKDYVNWKELEELECVTRWAYIDELLPKGGEK